ncbi:hypothetical protein CEXT_502021 [Caerostris extrusa]|uniref:Uncharacterized protein n=1 Tax=Caerostris extrusa TaxID=172846 RepID=A0AAV4MYP0_CAEEX|nr:hypothetical protein CEXT_502021 [Caerostris extrusa]
MIAKHQIGEGKKPQEILERGHRSSKSSAPNVDDQKLKTVSPISHQKNNSHPEKRVPDVAYRKSLGINSYSIAVFGNKKK